MSETSPARDPREMHVELWRLEREMFLAQEAGPDHLITTISLAADAQRQEIQAALRKNVNDG